LYFACERIEREVCIGDEIEILVRKLQIRRAEDVTGAKSRRIAADSMISPRACSRVIDVNAVCVMP